MTSDGNTIAKGLPFCQDLCRRRTLPSQNQIDLAPPQTSALRRVLYGLAALVAVHFAKEEEIYLPILDARLSEAQGRRLFEALERAAQEAKSATEQEIPAG